MRLVEGPGADLYDRPETGSGDRTFLGRADLHYWAIGGRRRWTGRRRSAFELGFGATFDGRFSSVVEFRDPSLGRQTYPDTFFHTLLIEGYFTRALGRRFAVKTGLSFDTNVETSNLQTLAVGALRVF